MARPLPVQKGWVMGTTPGMHNHISRARADQPRRTIDAVFGVDAPIIAGLPIEVGHGAKSAEWQLAEHLVRIRSADGDDALRTTYERLIGVGGFDMAALNAELVARGLKAVQRAMSDEARKTFEQALPDGKLN